MFCSSHLYYSSNVFGEIAGFLLTGKYLDFRNRTGYYRSSLNQTSTSVMWGEMRQLGIVFSLFACLSCLFLSPVVFAEGSNLHLFLFYSTFFSLISPLLAHIPGCLYTECPTIQTSSAYLQSYDAFKTRGSCAC